MKEEEDTKTPKIVRKKKKKNIVAIEQVNSKV